MASQGILRRRGALRLDSRFVPAQPGCALVFDAALEVHRRGGIDAPGVGAWRWQAEPGRDGPEDSAWLGFEIEGVGFTRAFWRILASALRARGAITFALETPSGALKDWAFHPADTRSGMSSQRPLRFDLVEIEHPKFQPDALLRLQFIEPLGDRTIDDILSLLDAWHVLLNGGFALPDSPVSGVVGEAFVLDPFTIVSHVTGWPANEPVADAEARAVLLRMLDYVDRSGDRLFSLTLE